MRYFDYLLAGRAFAVGQRLTATGVTGAQFALFNPVGKNRVLYLYQLDITVTAAIEVDVFGLGTDPALTVGNTPSNASIGLQPALAKFEAQVVAQPAKLSTIASLEATTGGPVATILDRPLRIPAGFGVLISSAATAATVALVLGWVETGPDSDLAGE